MEETHPKIIKLMNIINGKIVADEHKDGYYRMIVEKGQQSR
jgi:hypothetical protein